MAKPGFIKGKHYSAYSDEVRRLKRNGDLDGAEVLLLQLIEATESEARANSWGVAPWYYEQLAIVYSKKKDRKAELEVLERYAGKRKAPGARPEKLAQRLERLKKKMSNEGD